MTYEQKQWIKAFAGLSLMAGAIGSFVIWLATASPVALVFAVVFFLLVANGG